MITNDYKLIFIHVPKCAGRSINDLFNQRFDHFTDRYYEQEYNKQWHNSEFIKFTIVRNPFDRLLSMYTYMMQHRRHIKEPISCLISGNFDPNSAEGFRGKDGELGSSFWFTSQWQRIISANGNVEIDKVFRHEEGMKPIEDFLGKLMGDISVPLTNQSAPFKRDYRDYYTEKTKKLAETFLPVIEDCKNLGYSF